MAAGLTSALFADAASTDVSIDALLAAALHLYTEKQLEKALAIVDNAGVTLVVAEASRRQIYQVSAYCPLSCILLNTQCR